VVDCPDRSRFGGWEIAVGRCGGWRREREWERAGPLAVLFSTPNGPVTDGAEASRETYADCGSVAEERLLED
jgi:hypothetical protein